MKKFFFANETPRSLAAMRIGLSVVFFCYFAARWPYAVELYSSDGLLMPLFPGTLRWLPVTSTVGVILLSSFLLFALAAAAIGWQTRLSLVVALILSTWFGLLDGVGTFTKYSAIGLHILVLLSFSSCGLAWSVDSRLIRDQSCGRYSQAPAWPRRLVQILICSIYWGSAITKLRIQDYASGDFLMFSLLDDQWGGQGPGPWLATHPSLLILSSVLVLFFEIAFPLLIWVPRLRLPMLACAVVFHLVVGSSMYLSIFSPVMLVALLAFTSDRDFDRVTMFLSSAFRGLRFGNTASKTKSQAASDSGFPESSRLASSVARRIAGLTTPHYFGCGALWMGTGFLIHYATDPIRVLHAYTDPQLEVFDSVRIDRMLAAQLPAYSDYFHRFEIGSRVSNSRARGAQTQFRKGETVHGFARLIQDHPTLQLEWLLIGPDGREAGRLSRQLDRFYVYATAGFELKQHLPSGRYRFILQADGHEVAEKSFQLIE